MADLSTGAREAMGQAGRRYFEQHFGRDRLLQQLEGWMLELTQPPRS